MGQYFKPCMIENNQWVYSHDYGNGLKLMEHSYIGNNFVRVVMKLLSKGGDWYKKPIVWCGDYYEEEEGKSHENYYHKATDDKKIKPNKSYPIKLELKSIIVNHTKKQYVILSPIDFYKNETKIAEKMLKVIEGEGNDEDWIIIHPLPLLTALGNGNGGGDFRGENDMIGYWARDIISVETKIPDKYEELKVEFKEDRTG